MYTRIVQHSIAPNYQLILHRQHEWWSDYPWFIQHVQGHRLLDLGFTAHTFFTRILCEYGFAVTGVDFDQPSHVDWNISTAKFTYVKADVRALPLEDDSFATIVAPSLLEHVGFYGDEQSGDGAIEAVTEWHRVLEPGGVLLLQVPYGAHSRVISFQGHPYYRIYTEELLESQLSGLDIEDIRCDSFEPHGWIPVSKAVANHIDHTRPFPPCVAKVAARKRAIGSRDQWGSGCVAG